MYEALTQGHIRLKQVWHVFQNLFKPGKAEKATYGMCREFDNKDQIFVDFAVNNEILC